MTFRRHDGNTPKPFLSMRNRRTTSSAASSTCVSPRFSSCRPASFSSRPGAALGVSPKSQLASQPQQPRDTLPTFGDAIYQHKTADAVFGTRKRGVIGRAADNDCRSSAAGLVRPVEVTRRLRSEVGTAGTATTSDIAVDPIRKLPTRLSPTAADWIPKSGALSPRRASLSYADVAKLGGGLPPPFPSLRKLNKTRTSMTSTGSVVRPGKNCGSSSSGRGSDAGDAGDTHSPRELCNKIASPAMKQQTIEIPACPHLGLGHGLGQLAGRVETDMNTDASAGLSLKLDFNGDRLSQAWRSPISHESPVLETPAHGLHGKTTPVMATPVVTAPAESTPKSSAHSSRLFTPDERLPTLLRHAELRGFGTSSFLPQTPEEYASVVDDTLGEQSAREAKMRAAQTSVLPNAALIYARKFLPPACYETGPVNSERELSQHSAIKPQCEAAWPDGFELWYAGRNKSRKLPRPRYSHSPGVMGRMGRMNSNASGHWLWGELRDL